MSDDIDGEQEPVSNDVQTAANDKLNDVESTEESMLSEEEENSGLGLTIKGGVKRIKRDSTHKPTLQDLKLVGDILFTETPTLKYSAEEQKEFIELGDVSKLTNDGRINLFSKGVEFERKGKAGLALQCYLACIQGLDNDVAQFTQLPLCLRHIARLYFAEEDYEKAVHFVQAEKLYYETAILSSEGTTNMEDEQVRKKPSKCEDLKYMMVKRAIEFEQLAVLCMENKNIGLALDYIGKAAKINESVHGKDDIRTRQCYEKFSYIYSEAGKIQYNDAMRRFQKKINQASNHKEDIMNDEDAGDDVYTPEQSLAQKIFSVILLIIFLAIIIVEIMLVILSFSKGYIYVPTSKEVSVTLNYIWRKVFS